MNITGGKYNGRIVKAPDKNIARPTLSKVRMSVFNMLFSIIGDFDGKTFLDMFGGSGIMGLEAVSRGFSKVIVCEKNKKAAEIIKSNYLSIGAEPNLHIGDSLSIVQKINETVDVVYIDPPYMIGIYEKALSNIPESKIIVVEHVTDVDFSKFKILKQKVYGDKYITILAGD